jgi:hypothetical protein
MIHISTRKIYGNPQCTAQRTNGLEHSSIWKLIDPASDSSLEIMFKKLLPGNASIVPKRNIHNYLKMLLNAFPLSNYLFWEARFPTATLIKTTYYYRLRVEGHKRIPLSSI